MRLERVLPVGFLYMAVAAVCVNAQNQPPPSVVPRVVPMTYQAPTQEQLAQLESELATNPDDLEAHTTLLNYYMKVGQGSRFIQQLLWFIQYHPESKNNLAMMSAILRPDGSAPNTAAEYQQVRSAWDQAATTHPDDPRYRHHGYHSSI